MPSPYFFLKVGFDFVRTRKNFGWKKMWHYKHLPVHSGHALQSLLSHAHFTLHGLRLLPHHFWHWAALVVVENNANARMSRRLVKFFFALKYADQERTWMPIQGPRPRVSHTGPMIILSKNSLHTTCSITDPLRALTIAFGTHAASAPLAFHPLPRLFIGTAPVWAFFGRRRTWGHIILWRNVI